VDLGIVLPPAVDASTGACYPLRGREQRLNPHPHPHPNPPTLTPTATPTLTLTPTPTLIRREQHLGVLQRVQRSRQLGGATGLATIVELVRARVPVLKLRERMVNLAVLAPAAAALAPPTARRALTLAHDHSLAPVRAELGPAAPRTI